MAEEKEGAKAYLSEKRAKAEAYLRDKEARFEDYVREHPLKSVACAALFGAATVGLWHMLRRRD